MADILVVGAGVAGTAAAILLAKGGFSVVLVDRRASIDDYKTLCTHFVQPVANSVFADLGLERLLSPDYSVQTKAAFRVPGGVIDTDEGYSDDPVIAYAHNLERRVFDLELRREAIVCGVKIIMDTNVCALERIDSGFSVDLSGPEGMSKLSSRFVVAADGRDSMVAKLLSVPVKQYPNDRAAHFCYCKGIPAPTNDRSIFVLNNNEMSFLYPLIENRTLLSIYTKRDHVSDWKPGSDIFSIIVEQMKAHIPDVDFSSIVADSRVFGYKKYDNQVRPPVAADIAFVGDAALSLDPMSGVGCSFALKSARMVADAFLEHPHQLSDALAAYQLAHDQFFPAHAAGIIADALVAKSNESVNKTYSYILHDEKLKRRYLALTARLIAPADFQSSYMLAVARMQRSTSMSQSYQ